MKLEVLCDPEAANAKFHAPFGTTIDGKRYDVATNGKAILCVPGTRYAVPKDPLPVKHLLSIPTPLSGTTRLSALREWALPRSERRRKTCSECDGTGESRHDCECEHCSWIGMDECERCGGDGWTMESGPQPVCGLFIGETALDRRLLGAVLEALGRRRDCDVIAHAEEGTLGTVKLSIGAIIAVVMPVRYDEGDSDIASNAFQGWTESDEA